MHSLCIILTKHRCTCCWLQKCILLWQIPRDTNLFAYGSCVLSKHTLFISFILWCSSSSVCVQFIHWLYELDLRTAGVMCEDVRRCTDRNTRTLKHELTPPLLHQLMTVYNDNPELGRKCSLRLAGTWGEEAVLFSASGTKTLRFWR